MNKKTKITIAIIFILAILTVYSKSLMFDKIISSLIQNDIKSLDIGERIKFIGIEFLDIPYIGGTLDSNHVEKCTVDLENLDCVTFMESTLALANNIRHNRNTFDDLVKQIEKTRYRNGINKGYISRLHYTSDWIIENTKNGYIKDITKELGGKKFNPNVYYMSQFPYKYKQLKDKPDLVVEIAKIEKKINQYQLFEIDKNKVLEIENNLKSGDLIAIRTNIKGLDYSHVGIAYKNEKGILKLMHASSSKKKVVIDVQLSEYLSSNKSATGITILRPIEQSN